MRELAELGCRLSAFLHLACPRPRRRGHTYLSFHPAAASASCDLATSNVGQMAAASPAPAVGHSHSSSSRLERVIVDCSPGSSRGV